jgi:hypothetical protein
LAAEIAERKKIARLIAVGSTLFSVSIVAVATILSILA